MGERGGPEPDAWVQIPAGHFLIVDLRLRNSPNVPHSDAHGLSDVGSHAHTWTRVNIRLTAHLAVIGVLQADGDPIEEAPLSLLELLQCLQLLLTLAQEIREAVYLLMYLQCLSDIEGDQTWGTQSPTILTQSRIEMAGDCGMRSLPRQP